MTWYDSLFLAPVRAINEVRSNVWSVALIITGIILVMHGHENVGASLVTGAFAVFRSSPDVSKDPTGVKVVTNDPVSVVPSSTPTSVTVTTPSPPDPVVQDPKVQSPQA